MLTWVKWISHTLKCICNFPELCILISCSIKRQQFFLCVSYNKSVISIWWFFCSCSSLPYNIVIEWRNASWIYRHVIEERTNDAWLPMPVIVTFDLICLWKDLPPVNTISPGTYYVGQNTLSRKFANDSRYHVPPFDAYHSHF